MTFHQYSAIVAEKFLKNNPSFCDHNGNMKGKSFYSDAQRSAIKALLNKYSKKQITSETEGN